MSGERDIVDGTAVLVRIKGPWHRRPLSLGPDDRANSVRHSVQYGTQVAQPRARFAID